MIGSDFAEDAMVLIRVANRDIMESRVSISRIIPGGWCLSPARTTGTQSETRARSPMSELIDNRAERIRTLRDIISTLHEGADPESVRGRLREIVKECDAGEIAAMEQELIRSGTPVEQITRMCDLHSELVRDVLVDRPHEPIIPGHPVHTFREENEALEQACRHLEEALAGEDDEGARARCRSALNELMDVEKHYLRKEHLLFPLLERHGIAGPSQVMWAKHDEARGLLARLGDAIADGAAGGWADRVREAAGPALRAVREMIVKEEKILLPMSLQTLTAMEWGQIHAQSPEFGWCLIQPGTEYVPPTADETSIREEDGGESLMSLPITGQPAPGALPSAGRGAADGGPIVFPTGALTVEQIRALFSTLPLDVTFVDAEDRVRFFTKPDDRIFVRPLAVIGRKVQHCHPPSSVGTVERILEDFRSGRQSVAEFWIEHRGRFIHIRYFAVRDEGGRYLGCLELTQDLTPLRALKGERRLLQYDT